MKYVATIISICKWDQCIEIELITAVFDAVFYGLR